MEVAQRVALNYFSTEAGVSKTSLKIKEVIPFKNNGELVFRIFNFSPTGYIVVSAENNTIPILGYGLDSNFKNEDAPPALLGLLSGYADEISVIRKDKVLADKGISDKWKLYSSDNFTPLKSYSPGTFLLQTKWGQDYPFSNSCPLDPNTNGEHCSVGCTAVALGQILNYWECKVFPDSVSSYYCTYLDTTLTVTYYNKCYNWGDIGTDVTATADFLRDCAVAVKSDTFAYHNTQSSITKANSAFLTYYGFNTNGIKGRMWYHDNDVTWMNMLKTDINAGRPVYYKGTDSNYGGHAWVVDGYDSNNYFHCNWGWGDDSGENHFYSLSALNPNGHNFNNNNLAIFGIHPILDACSGLPGASFICNSNESYSVTIPSSASVVWSKSLSLQQVGGNTGTTYTVKAVSCSQGSSGTVTATIKNSQGGTFLVRSKNVIVSGPPSGSVSLNITNNLTGQSVQPYNMCPNTTYILECVNSSSCNTSNYNWTLPYGMNQLSASSNWVLINTNSSPGGILMVHSSTCCSDCGSNVLILTENLDTDGYDCDNYYMMISPNPSDGEVTISILSKNGGDDVKSDFTASWDIHVVSVNRQVEIVKEAKIEGNKYKLNTSGWKQGVYVVQAKYNDKIVEGKLMVK